MLATVVHQSLRRRLWPNNSTLRLFWRFFKKTDAQTSPTSHSLAHEATFDLPNTYKFIRLQTFPKQQIKIERDLALHLYKQMTVVRRLEEDANAMYREKIVRGFCHLYTGQEAVCVGIHSAMRADDHLITAYRCHGWSYVMGITPYQILAELAGRETGIQRGKGGSMHMYCERFYGGNGIVGAQVPLGTGVAFALKNEAKGNVCIALYGDGAANQGQIFESYNIACLWKLPVIFVCENNEYGMGTTMKRSSCSIEYYARGFPLPGIYVDGMDVLAIRNAMQFAIDFVQQQGPIIIETHTYRYFGHSMSDPGTSYRSRDEITQMRKTRDASASFRDKAIAKGLLEEEQCKKIDADIKKEMKEVAEKVKQDKEIKPEELFADVYMDNKEPAIRDTIGNWQQHLRVGKTLEKSHIKMKSFTAQVKSVEAQSIVISETLAKENEKSVKSLMDGKEPKSVYDQESKAIASDGKKPNGGEKCEPHSSGGVMSHDDEKSKLGDVNKK